MSLKDMTNGELMSAGEAIGMTFTLVGQRESVCIGTPLLGWDKDVTRRCCEIDREIRRRWDSFVAFVELRLLASRPVQLS